MAYRAFVRAKVACMRHAQGDESAAAAAADFAAGIYSPAWTDRTYSEILHRAEMLLARGETVILDASWTTEATRARAAELAAASQCALVALRCSAPPAVVAARARERVGSESDADEQVAVRLAAAAEPWPGARTIAIDHPLDECLAAAERAVRT